MKVSVLGAGAWGTVLARLLYLGKNEVTLWGHNRERLEEIRRTGRNVHYLPEISLPLDWRVESDLDRAISGAECIVVAVPSTAFREVTNSLAHFHQVIVSVTKGIEYDTGLTMCGILRQTAEGAAAVALSGPTIAAEVAREMPSAIVAASSNPAAAQLVQQLFHRPTFRVYTGADPHGVELGGALKNVIAIAAGMCDGLGFGDNSKAALITRGIVEIRRLGVACGACADTFAGLSGLGDLTVTCFSKFSRNRTLGERLGRGEKLDHILQTTKSIAEGYPTARSAFRLARKLQASTPIIDEVFAMLYEGKDIVQALHDLTSRDSKAED
ncbi:MAG: NAD(P)-dependent glycerol-3-phosphate dehydrogenase [Verrucomicrobiales bacterium]|nr:NAD(P)-dependent glycerol-3-phosphate dehydrogenase [Verrucomicrobiales bacterium]